MLDDGVVLRVARAPFDAMDLDRGAKVVDEATDALGGLNLLVVAIGVAAFGGHAAELFGERRELSLIAPGERDARSFFVQRPRHGAAQHARRPRHQRSCSREIHGYDARAARAGPRVESRRAG